MRTVLERFEVKVRKTETCWIWTAGCLGGYGRFRFNGCTQNAHRVSWELFCGPIPSGMHVLHDCDNPPCVNPAHLFLGTNIDNIADRHRKGRDAKGTKNGQHTMPERTVRGDRHWTRLHSGSVVRGDAHVWHGDRLRVAGENNAQAKVTAETVIAIRAEAETLNQCQLSRKYGLHASHIAKIIRGQLWKFVPGANPNYQSPWPRARGEKIAALGADIRAEKHGDPSIRDHQSGGDNRPRKQWTGRR